ncbi:MAG: GNAT family N-acetyltransferase [Bacilli bacterium]|nr:GNAT family N-acetyltransferase [Bacilli bacterium]
MTINKATPDDYREIVSCFSTAVETIEDEKERAEVSETLLPELLSEINEGHVYIAKMRNKGLGFALISHSVEDSFFPQTHSFTKATNILDSIDYKGENVMVLRAIFVNSMHQRKGNGTEIIKSLFGRYPKSTWLCFASQENKAAAKFLKANGFLSLGLDGSIEASKCPCIVYGKKYRPSGLCREAFW